MSDGLVAFCGYEDDLSSFMCLFVFLETFNRVNKKFIHIEQCPKVK